MYIRINEPIGEDRKVEVSNALKIMGIDFDIFNSAERIVCQEEARDRVEAWEETNLISYGDDIKEEIIDHLEDKLYNNDYVISGEVICDVTNEVMNEYDNSLMKKAI